MTVDIAETKAARRAHWLFWPFAAISAALAFRIANGDFTDSDPAGNAMASGFAVLLALVVAVLLVILSLLFAFVKATRFREVLAGVAFILALSLFVSSL